MELHEMWNNEVTAKKFWKPNENKVFVIIKQRRNSVKKNR